MSSVMCVRRLTEEKKEVESEIQRQPKAEVVPMTLTLLAHITLSSVILHCFPPVACPVVVVVGCRAEGAGADQ